MKFEKFFLAATHVGSGPLFPSAALFFIQAPAPLGHHSASRLYDPVVRSTHVEHDFFLSDSVAELDTLWSTKAPTAGPVA
jgi:hypothetical protein